MVKLNAPQKAAQAGIAQAEADIGVGHLRYIHCFPNRGGTFADWVLRLHATLKEELGLDCFVFVECPWSGVRSRKTFAEAYNQRMQEEVAWRFGADAESNVRRKVCGW